MIRHILSFILVFTFYSQICAQNIINDSLAENLSINENVQLFIKKTRNLLLEKFNENKISELKETINYIDSQTINSNFLILNPPEKIMLLFRIADYNQVFDYIETIEQQRTIKNAAQPDDLTYLLFNYFGQNKDTYYFDIDNSILSNEKKSFLKILLDNMLYDDTERFIKGDDLILNCKTFLDNYPESPFYSQVKTFGGEYELSPWGFSYSMCAGMNFYTGDFNKFWKNGTYLEISLEGNYKRLNAMFALSSSRQKAEINKEINGIEWEKGYTARWIGLDFMLGYTAFQNYKQKLIPFASIGFIHIKPTDNTSENNNALENKNYEAPRYGCGILYNYSFIRLKYSYTKPCFDNKYQLNGSGHALSVGFVFSFQGFKKD